MLMRPEYRNNIAANYKKKAPDPRLPLIITLTLTLTLTLRLPLTAISSPEWASPEPPSSP